MSHRPDEFLAELAKACRILEMEGHGDFTLGHAAFRDPQGHGFWMKRNAYGLGEIRGPEDFVLVDMNGVKMSGEGGRHSEWPIHSEIFRLRPDIHVTFHTHPLHACIMSGANVDVEAFTLDADYFVAIPRHTADVALIKTRDEGEAMAQALGPHKALFLANHGVVFCGDSVAEAACIGVFLEHACRAHVMGAAANLQPVFPTAETRSIRHQQIMSPIHVDQTWAYLNRKLDHLCAANPLSNGIVYR